jgi:mono/diheme cytochrome c family protein
MTRKTLRSCSRIPASLALRRFDNHRRWARGKVLGAMPLLAIALTACDGGRASAPVPPLERRVAEVQHARGHGGSLVRSGKEIFRFDTFGDETFWTETLRMHEVIETSVSPRIALSVGLKVDAEALPSGILETVDLDDPKTTVALLKLNAVLGVQGQVRSINGQDRLVRFGITCALCHSTVDNSVAPGIGRRLDGWANTTLDPGAIIALSPALTPAQKAVYNSWGPGKYDPRFNIDGRNTPIVLPPIYGLRKVARETYTADGPISYWNAYVAVTQMHGQGTFVDPRLGISVVQTPDLVTPKLPALLAYQLSLETPDAPAGSFDRGAAGRGRAVFVTVGRCAQCHVGPALTDVNRGVLHDASETGMDPAYALRTATKRYRTTPLRGLWQHGPYFHDGSAATLADVVEHYNRVLALGLSQRQKHDLVEYLKSL